MASPPPMVALESLDERRQGLRVEFHWRVDRYVHTIYRVTGDTMVPIISSLEGTEDDMFPTSPGLVDLHRQEKILFLTGATSICHWSLSVQAKHAPSLVFEVACRPKAQPTWLGSTYEVLHPSAQATLLSQSNLWSSSHQIRISPVGEIPLKFPSTLQWNYEARS